MHIIAMTLYWCYLNLADGQKIAKLKSLPNKLCIRYLGWHQKVKTRSMVLPKAQNNTKQSVYSSFHQQS